MWALLKKNFSHGYWSGGILTILITLSISISDVFVSFTLDIWPVFLLVVLFLSFVAAGGSEFTDDSSKEAERFLEYLPLKRSSIWLANYLEVFIALLLMVICAFWYQAISFEHSVVGSFGPFQGISNRWDLLIGGGALSFWVFSFHIFFKGYFKNDLLLGILIIPLLLIVGELFNLFLAAVDISPTFLEAAPVFALSAFLFSLSSFLIYSYILSSFARWKVFSFICAPVFLVLIFLFFVHLFICCESWKELEPGEKFSRLYVSRKILKKNGNTYFVVNPAISKRSGRRMIIIDADTGKIIQNLKGFLQTSSPEGKILYRTSHFNNSLLSGDWRIVMMDPDGENRRTLLQRPDISFSIKHIVSSSFSWTGDGNFFVYIASTRNRSNLVVVNLKILKTIASVPISRSSLMNKNGMVLAQPPIPASELVKYPEIQPLSRNYFLYNVNTGEKFSFTLPGSLLFFSPDFEKVICLKYANSDKDNKTFSIVMHDVRSGNDQAIIPSSELASKYTSQPLETMGSWRLRIPTKDISNYKLDAAGKSIYLSPNFDKLLWVKKELNGQFCVFSLVLFDLKTMERTIIKTDAIPRQAVANSNGHPVCGFTSDGRAVVCNDDNDIFLIDLSTGKKKILSKNLGAVKEIFLSPGFDKVMTTKRDCTRDAGGKWRTEVVFYENGKVIGRSFFSTSYLYSSWFDNDYALVNFDDKIFKVKAKGGEIKQIFPRKTP
jgi:hypothetical protein